MAQWLPGLAQLQCLLASPTGRRIQDVCSERLGKEGNKPLNVERTYADHKPEELSEHVQNWYDQCVKLAREAEEGAKLRLLHLSGDTWKIYCQVFSVQGEDRLAGCIEIVFSLPARTDKACRPYSIRFTNFDTTVTPDMLKFGHTTKRDDAYAAGYFGEGVKVEINRLSACGATVTYRTGGHEWIFGYNPSNELCVEFYCLQRPNAFFQAEILNIGSDALPKEENFLFLQPDHTALCLRPPSGTHGVSILLHPNHVGKFYLHGIRVELSNTSLHHLFGLDYSGPLKPVDFGMGRDRTHIDSFRVQGLLHTTMAAFDRMEGECPHAIVAAMGITDVNNNSPYPRQHVCAVCLGADFRHRVLNLLLADGDNIVLHSLLFIKTYPPEGAAHFVLRAFVERFGPRAVPMTKVEAVHEKASESLLQVRFVVMSDSGVSFLRRCKECLTLDACRATHALDFLRLPELVRDTSLVLPYPPEVGHVQLSPWPSPEAAELCEKTRHFIVILPHLHPPSSLIPELSVRSYII